MVHKKQIQPLIAASALKRENALQRANSALKLMQEKDIPINFESVSKYACVAKSWLYKDSKIKDEINKLRNAQMLMRVLVVLSTLTDHVH